MLRPTAYLTFTLAGDDASPATASAVKRSYSYVAPTKIVAARAETGKETTPLSNSIAMEVKLDRHPYWQSDDEGADGIWSGTLLPWLDRKLRTLFGTVLEYNNETRRSFAGKLSYRSVEVGLAPHAVIFDLEPDSNLRDVRTPLTAIRNYLNSPDRNGATGLRFTVPSDTERGDSDWFDVAAPDGTTVRVPQAAIPRQG